MFSYESKMIDKKELLSCLILLIKDDIEKQRRSYESARNASIDAPGRMQSRYDTIGVESAWVADGLAKALNEKEMFINRLANFRLDEVGDKVSLGSIIGISTEGTSLLEYYFMLPVAGGYKLQVGDKTIITLTPITPLGKTLIGKQVGDEIDIKFPKERTIVIDEVA